MVLLGRRLYFCAFFLILGLFGCAIVESLWSPRSSFGFDHRFHLEEVGLSCEDCHEDVEDSDRPGMPSFDFCMACHEDLDEGKAPMKRADAFFVDEELQAIRASALSDEVIFSHRAHAMDHGIECGDCHTGIEKSRRITGSDRVTMADCMDCHEETTPGKNGDCDSCHSRITEDWQPGNHSQNWDRFHGQVVRADTGKTVDDCSLCHTEARCVRCHQEEPPRDHNNHWRRRGHSIASTIDRDRCDVCHRADFCDRCHQESAPRNHTGGWGDPLNRHCIGCHFPLRSQGCIVCHRGDPSHSIAPPLPINQPHRLASEAQCRECHVPLRLRHPDSGDSCRLCHR